MFSDIATQVLGILKELRLLLQEKRRCMRHARTGTDSEWSSHAIERALKNAEQTAHDFTELAKDFHADECVKAEAELNPPAPVAPADSAAVGSPVNAAPS